MFPHAFWFASGSYFLWHYNLIWLHSAVRTNVKVLDQHMYKIEEEKDKNKTYNTKLLRPFGYCTARFTMSYVLCAESHPFVALITFIT